MYITQLLLISNALYMCKRQLRPVGSNYRLGGGGGGAHINLGGGGGAHIIFFKFYFFWGGGGGGIFVQIIGGGHGSPCPPYSYGPAASQTPSV